MNDRVPSFGADVEQPLVAAAADCPVADSIASDLDDLSPADELQGKGIRLTLEEREVGVGLGSPPSGETVTFVSVVAEKKSGGLALRRPRASMVKEGISVTISRAACSSACSCSGAAGGSWALACARRRDARMVIGSCNSCWDKGLVAVLSGSSRLRPSSSLSCWLSRPSWCDPGLELCSDRS